MYFSPELLLEEPINFLYEFCLLKINLVNIDLNLEGLYF